MTRNEAEWVMRRRRELANGFEFACGSGASAAVIRLRLSSTRDWTWDVELEDEDHETVGREIVGPSEALRSIRVALEKLGRDDAELIGQAGYERLGMSMAADLADKWLINPSRILAANAIVKGEWEPSPSDESVWSRMRDEAASAGVRLSSRTISVAPETRDFSRVAA